MRLLQLDLGDRKRVQDFIDLPFAIYRGCPQWVPPLEMDLRLILNPKKHPFFRHSQAAFFLAYSSGRAVGRIAVLDHRRYNEYNREKTAFFYLFECEQDPDACSALFEAALGWARQRGLERILGPKGFTPLDGSGLLVQGFEHRPAFGMPYSLSYYSDMVEAAGFTACGETVSGYLGRATARFPERIHALAERVAERRGLTVINYRNRRELKGLVPHLKQLYNDSLEGTAGNYPLDDEDMAALADQLLWFADPSLIKLVKKDDRIVGFLFAYPDISAALQKTNGRLFPLGWIRLLRELRRTDWININGAGLVEEYRGLGGTAILFSEIAKSLLNNRRFVHADIVQIGTDNDAMQREMKNFGIEFYKKHRLYSRDL